MRISLHPDRDGSGRAAHSTLAPITIATIAALQAMPPQMAGANHQGGRFLFGFSSMTFLSCLRASRGIGGKVR